jgi:transmembrane sensor
VLDWIEKEQDGSLNEQDRALLLAWRQADPANEAAYQDYRELLPLIPAADPAARLDPDIPEAVWRRFEALLPPTAAVVPAPRSGPGRLLLRIAAVLVLLIAALWYIYRPAGDEIQRYAAVTATREVLLPDRSQVVLRKGAVLTVKAGFDGHTARILHLVGEAFFQVNRNEAKPFIVETGALQVQVLGTSFYVSAPEGGEAHSVQVLEGRVAVTQRSSGRRLERGPGERVNWSEAGPTGESTLGDPNALAWHTGVLVFKGEPLSEVLRVLEDHYGIRIRLSDPAMSACRFSGRFERESAPVALRIVATSMDMTLKSSPEGVYYLTGGKCH